MSVNGAKTVDLTGWKPPHDCQVSYRVHNSARMETKIGLSWTRPRITGLARIVFFDVILSDQLAEKLSKASLFGVLSGDVNLRIDEIVHNDSLKLLARGKRSQRADTDRFEAEQKLKGELCPI